MMNSAPILSGIETISIGMDVRRRGDGSLASASGSSLFPRNMDIAMADHSGVEIANSIGGSSSANRNVFKDNLVALNRQS
jgi:hypothetical protein